MNCLPESFADSPFPQCLLLQLNHHFLTSPGLPGKLLYWCLLLHSTKHQRAILSNADKICSSSCSSIPGPVRWNSASVCFAKTGIMKWFEIENLAEMCSRAWLPSLESESGGLFSVQCNQMATERSSNLKETQNYCRQMQNDRKDTNQFPEATAGPRGAARPQRHTISCKKTRKKFLTAKNEDLRSTQTCVFFCAHFPPSRASHFKIKCTDFYGNMQPRPHMQGQ